MKFLKKYALYIIPILLLFISLIVIYVVMNINSKVKVKKLGFGYDLYDCDYDFYRNDLIDGKYLIAKKKGKVGLIDLKGKEIVKCAYSKCDTYDGLIDNKYLVMMKNDKWGMIDLENNIIIPFEYDQIDHFDDLPIIKVYQWLYLNGATKPNSYKIGILDYDGKEILPMEYDYIKHISDKVFVVGKDNIYQFYNYENDEFEGEYDGIRYVQQFIIASKDNFYYLIDSDHNSFVKSFEGEYDKVIYDSDNNYIITRKEDKYSVYDLKRQSFISTFECNLGEIDKFCGNNIVVENEGKYGWIDINGNEILPCKYSSISECEENVYKVSFVDDKYGVTKHGLVNIDGKDLLSSYYEIIESDNNITLALTYSHRVDFFDSELNKVFSAENVKSARYCSEHFIVVKYNESYISYTSYIYDKEGNIIFEGDYDDLIYYSDKLIVAKKDKKWGIIDISGNIIIPFQYEEELSFEQGVAIVKKDNKYGCIDENGNTIIPFKYDEIDFEKDFIIVKMREDEDSLFVSYKYGCIDKTGKIIIPCENSSIIFLNNFGTNYIMTYNDDRTGISGFQLYDIKGQALLKRRYDYINQISEKQFVAKDNGILYLITVK